MQQHPVLLPRLALASLAAVWLGTIACTSADEVGGCWTGESGKRSVSFFLDSDDAKVVGQEIGSDHSVIEFSGTWERTDASRYRIDGGCDRVEGGGSITCNAVPSWSMQCTLVDDTQLDCVGAPFSAKTTLSPCENEGAAVQ